ncbi:MAG: energy transducer TonB [Acidimicrobiia bacterium]|nr:energy transducer TonB [Acidimicrobiia bacterium]
MTKEGVMILSMMAVMGSMAGLEAQLRVPSADALKAVETKVTPQYPPIAKQMRVTGKVELEVTIGTDGAVEAVKVISGNALLTASATEAMKKWKFQPFTENGEPSKAVTVINIDYKL